MPLSWGGALPEFFAIFWKACPSHLEDSKFFAREKFVGGAARAKEKTPESPAAHKGRELERRTLAALAACLPQGGRHHRGKTSIGTLLS